MGAKADVTEYRAPLVLLAVGFVVMLIQAGMAESAGGFVITIVFRLIGLVIGVAVGIGACFLVASMMGTSFGYLRSAIVKLAGVFAFTSALSGFVGGWGLNWLITVPVYLGLLMWLFELYLYEAFVYALVLWVVQFMAIVFLVMAFMSMVGA
jgi:hypothetical protein